ncbi:CARDB domain-containing protein [Chloroflexota bacterium]
MLGEDSKMIKRILIATIVLSLVFTLGSSGISGPTGGQACASSLTSVLINSVAPDTEANEAKMVTFLATSLPDLVVESITASPTHPSIGDTVTFTVIIRNQGSSKANNSYLTCRLDDALWTSALVSSINPGATVTKTFFLKAEFGSHTIKVAADSNEEVPESDETNNEKTFAFSTLAPDLVIESITWSPEPPSRGDTVTFSVKIKNQGTGSAGSSRVDFYIDDSSRGYQDVPRIDANETVTKVFTWVAKAGFHAIKAIVDKDDRILEFDETNNDKTVSFQTLSPDLVIETVVWEPENPSESDNVTFTGIVKNQGSGRAGYSFAAYYIDDDYIDSVSVSPIDAGASVNTTLEWETKAGAHTIKVIADHTERVDETDETNNEKEVIFTPLAPDLIIESITWAPENPSKSDNITFTVSVRNQGGGRASPSRVYFYIDDFSRGSQVIDEISTDTAVGTTFLWIAKAGSHEIKAIVDKDDRVFEGDETNNEMMVPFETLPPDLFIERITWSPESPSIGDTVTFTVAIANQDSGRASISYVAYYIDGSFLSSATVNSINATATENKTFTWIAEVGPHVIKAFADFSEKVDESVETNNEKEVTFVALAPDLVIETISGLPVRPSIGDTVTFTVAIKNQGNDISGSFIVDLYIDGSLIGYQDIQPVDPGATVTELFTWTADGGAHTLKAVVDSNKKVIEDNEYNNEKKIIFPAPDLFIERITWSPANPTIEDTVTFAVTIKNQGSDISGSFVVEFYIDDSLISYQDVQQVEPGTAVRETFTWAAEAGSHVIRAVVDPRDKVTEDDETNNEETLTLSIPAPSDLIIEAIIWSPENPSESDNVTFTVTLNNQGVGRTTYSSVAYYIDDTYLAIDSVNPIDPGASANRTFNWIAEAGSHVFKAVVDFNSEVAESDETNNAQTANLSAILPSTPASESASGARPPGAPAVTPTPVKPPEKEGTGELLFIVALIIVGGAFIMILLRSRKQAR